MRNLRFKKGDVVYFKTSKKLIFEILCVLDDDQTTEHGDYVVFKYARRPQKPGPQTDPHQIFVLKDCVLELADPGSRVYRWWEDEKVMKKRKEDYAKFHKEKGLLP